MSEGKDANMCYYELLSSTSNKNAIVCYLTEESDKFAHKYGIKTGSFYGKVLPKMDSKLKFFYDRKEGNTATDFLINDCNWLIASERLVTLLQSMCDNIEYISVEIIEKNDKELLENYKLVNILNVIDALCLKESEYLKYGIFKRSYTILKYAVWYNKVINENVFLLPKETPIFVSEDFLQLAREMKITGVDYHKIRVISSSQKEELIDSRSRKNKTEKKERLEDEPGYFKSNIYSIDDVYKEFSKWLDDVLSIDIPSEVVAVNFNLYEAAHANAWEIELIGAADFNENDSDWACDEIFTTRNKLLRIPKFKDIDDYEKWIRFCGQCIDDYLTFGLYHEKLKQYRAVTIGFVDGDIDIRYLRRDNNRVEK
jgi:hypothetical protein